MQYFYILIPFYSRVRFAVFSLYFNSLILKDFYFIVPMYHFFRCWILLTLSIKKGGGLVITTVSDSDTVGWSVFSSSEKLWKVNIGLLTNNCVWSSDFCLCFKGYLSFFCDGLLPAI